MSVFRVKLQNTQQGLLDKDPTTGLPFTTSKQRTMFATGPLQRYRELHDGDEFTDCNYWKRFAYPQVPLDEAFISVVTDDGSIYSEIPGENTYALTYGGSEDYDVDSAATFDDNYIDIIGDTGGYAVFAQITNLGTGDSQDIKVQLNGSAVFNLANGDTQVFNQGDLSISKLAFEGSGDDDTTIQILLSVRSVCNS